MKIPEPAPSACAAAQAWGATCPASVVIGESSAPAVSVTTERWTSDTGPLWARSSRPTTLVTDPATERGNRAGSAARRPVVPSASRTLDKRVWKKCSSWPAVPRTVRKRPSTGVEATDSPAFRASVRRSAAAAGLPPNCWAKLPRPSRPPPAPPGADSWSARLDRTARWRGRSTTSTLSRWAGSTDPSATAPAGRAVGGLTGTSAEAADCDPTACDPTASDPTASDPTASDPVAADLTGTRGTGAGCLAVNPTRATRQSTTSSVEQVSQKFLTSHPADSHATSPRQSPLAPVSHPRA